MKELHVKYRIYSYIIHAKLGGMKNGSTKSISSVTA
jgi:hypothetical protein